MDEPLALPLSDYGRRPAALFTDVDGTMTTGGRLHPTTYTALWALADAGLPLVVVTGRPAAWGDAMIRTWPVQAVITENGGVTYLRGDGGRIEKRYGLAEADIRPLRERMLEAVREIGERFAGAGLSGDSRFREVDLAIDWNEDARLPRADAERITLRLRELGFEATRSSVHVNFGPAGVDKLTACRSLIAEGFGQDLGEATGGNAENLDDYLYIGDALNDAPLFRGFPHSVGVANIREVWDELPDKPRYVTTTAEGRGFEELARAILAASGI